MARTACFALLCFAPVLSGSYGTRLEIAGRKRCCRTSRTRTCSPGCGTLWDLSCSKGAICFPRKRPPPPWPSWPPPNLWPDCFQPYRGQLQVDELLPVATPWERQSGSQTLTLSGPDFRISPYEWSKPHPCNNESEVLETNMNLHNSIWHNCGSLMQQGSDIAPK